MPAGTPTQLDSYWLSQSSVFKERVTVALFQTFESINSEATTGVTGAMPTSVHVARKNFVAQIANPSSFQNWLTQFVLAAAADSSTGGVIQLATVSATNYTPITSAALGDTASAEGGNIPDTVISNAISAAFNTFIQGI